MTKSSQAALNNLQWHLDNGVDECIAEATVDRFQATPPVQELAAPVQATVQAAVKPAVKPGLGPPGRRPSALASAGEAAGRAEQLAREADSLDALKAAMAGFELCPLKATASNLVFGAGNPAAQVMFIGEAPGADEDRQGLPFVGVSGQLLDRMMASIGLDREHAYITNILPWRPPGNRKPTPPETAMCLPFIRRHIALVAPRVLVCVGGTSAQNLLALKEGITRSRGRWFIYDPEGRAIATMAIFHPAYLLRSPALKRDAWRDLQAIRQRLDEIAAA